MKKVSCREAGFDCNYIIEGYTENDLFRNGEKHALNMHGMKREDFTPRAKSDEIRINARL